MKKQVIALGLLGAIAAAAGLASTTEGFVLLNPGRKWFQGINGGPNDLPVLYRVNSGGESSVGDADNGVTAVRNSLTRWNSEVQVNIFSTTTTSSNAIGNDGQNVVSFNDPGRIVRNSIAVTLVGYYNSGQIETINGIQFRRYIDADISFSNKLDFTTQAVGNCSGEYDIVATGTHEGGHALGLDHSAAGAALMYPSIGACEFKGIATDDHNGVNTIYTPGFSGGGGCTATEARLGSLSCSAPSNGPNCMIVAVSVVDNCGNGVGNASVTVQLAGNNGEVLTGTAATNASGAVSFGLRCANVASTSYTVTVTNISSTPAWDANDAANAPNPITCFPR